MDRQPRRDSTTPRQIGWTASLAICVVATPAAANDLFRIDATATSGPALSATSSASSLPDLIEDLVETQEDFAAFSGRDVQGSLDYAGIANAIVVDVNAAGTSATVQIPQLGFSRNFAGSDPDDLEDEIKDFLFREGQSVYADFLELVREQTVIDALDGNPTSVTGRLASNTMRAHVLGPWLSAPRLGYVGQVSPASVREDDGLPIEGPAYVVPSGRSYLQVTGAAIDGDDFDGMRYELSGFGERVGERLGVSLGGFTAWRDLEGTGMLQSGLSLGLPVRVIADAPVFDGGARLEMRVVPVAQLGAAGSIDAGAGGTFFGYGGVVAVRVMTETLVLAAGAQSLWFDGIDAEFELGDENFQFETELNQHVLSFGGSVGWRPADWLLLDAGYAYHDYRQDAGVSYWGSPSAGASAALGDSLSLRVAYEADLAERVDTHRLSLGLRVSY